MHLEREKTRQETLSDGLREKMVDKKFCYDRIKNVKVKVVCWKGEPPHKNK